MFSLIWACAGAPNWTTMQKNEPSAASFSAPGASLELCTNEATPFPQFGTPILPTPSSVIEVNVGPWTPCSTVPRKKSRRWSALRMSAWCCFSLSPRRSLPLANAPTTFSVSAITERLCVRAFAGRVHKAIRAVLALQTILRPRRKPRQGLLVSASREAESTEEQPKP